MTEFIITNDRILLTYGIASRRTFDQCFVSWRKLVNVIREGREPAAIAYNDSTEK